MEKDKRNADQPIVDKFLEDFAKSLSKPAVNIDFILLFGSAARGEWKKGVSDVDILIQAVKVPQIRKRYTESQRTWTGSLTINTVHDV